jgi:hypothetical protein
VPNRFNTVGRFISFERFAKEMEQLPKEMADATKRGVRAGLKKGETVVQEEILNTPSSADVAGPPVDTYEMINSVRSAPTTSGGKIWMDDPKAIFMEEGTRPHFPPLAPLVEWVKRKITSDPIQARSIAYAIQQKIGERGLAPRRYFRRAMRRIVNEVIPPEVKRELRNMRRRQARAGKR